MARMKKMKTYGRSNTSLVNNSVDASNILFGIKKPKKIIRKKKEQIKNFVKELCSRPKWESVLGNDSLQISTEDTFDKLLKQSKKSPKTTSRVNCVVDISKSLNKSEQDTFYSPIVTRQRKKKYFDSTSSLKIAEITDSFDHTHRRRLREPSEEQINVSLEIEKEQKNKPGSFLHSFKIPHSFECSKLGVSIDTFSKNLHPKLLTNCSTPVAPFKHPNIINQTISPVNVNSVLQDEKEESDNISHTKNKTPNNPVDRSKFKNINSNYTDATDLSSVQFEEPSVDNNNTPQNKRISFITLRKRKILKNFDNSSRQKHNSNNILTTSLDSFSNSEKTNSITSVTNQCSLKDFESFEKSLFPVNFVTKRKITSIENDSFTTNQNPVICKELRTKLEKLPLHLINSSISRLESNVGHSYSKNISLNDSFTTNQNPVIYKKLCIKLEQLPLHLTNSSISRLESNVGHSYSKNISLNDFESFDQSFVPVTFVTKRKITSIENDSFTTNQNPVICKKLCIKLEKLPLHLTNSSISRLESNVGHSYSKNISLNDLESFEQSLGVSIDKIDRKSQEDEIKKIEINLIQTENFERSYKDNYDICNSPLPVVAVKVPEEIDIIDLWKEESLDVINSSILDTFSQNIKIETKNNPTNSRKSEIVPDERNIIDLCEEESLDVINSSILDIFSQNIKMKTKNNSTKSMKSNITVNNVIENNTLQNLNDAPSIIFSSATFDNQLNTSVTSDAINSSISTLNSRDFGIDDFKLPKLIQLKGGKSWKRSMSIYKRTSTCFDEEDRCSPSRLFNQRNNQRLSSAHLVPLNPLSDVRPTSMYKRTSTCFDEEERRSPSRLSNHRNSRRLSSVRLVPLNPLSDVRSTSMYNRTSTCFGEEERRRPSKLSNQRNSRRLSSVRLVPLNPDVLSESDDVGWEFIRNKSYVPDQIIEDSLEDSIRCLSLNQRNSLNNKSQLDQVPITARDVVLRRCGQTEPLEFSECFPDNILQHCHKIGEGVFGEVFLFRNPSGGTSVIKIVPVEGDLIVNGERQKKFEEVLSEIIITTELSNLRTNKRNGIPAFTEVQKINCVQGRYPEKLIFLWDEFDETRGSENDCPDIFKEDQHYIVFQMAYGGKDLESFDFTGAMQAYSMFQQVAIALAVAEEELRFEHRDLHWGNVLISTVESKKIASFNLDNRNYEIPTRGVEVAIIDFTLSRIEHDGLVIFNDLSLDPDLFSADGDYQFEIYRLMQKKNRNNWKEFEPFTNLLWLHYILDKAVLALRYKNTKTKRHRDYLDKLKMLKDDVLRYHNVKDFVFAKLLDV